MSTTDRGTLAPVRGTDVRVSPAQARAALQLVLGLPVTQAVARLRRGPGACEQIARLMDGDSTPGLVVAGASVGPGKDAVRIRRKAHGMADWITSPTSNVVITLGTALAEPAITELAGPEPELAAAPIWERTLPQEAAKVLDRLYVVLDPELGINIIDLGFVREISVSPEGVAAIAMTLTTPTCPLTGVMINQIRSALIGEDPVVTDFRVDWVWTPSWRPRDLSPDGVDQLLVLGFDPAEF